MELSKRGCCPSPVEVVARLAGDDVPQLAPDMPLREHLAAAERLAEEARLTELLGAANCDEVKGWLDYFAALERTLSDLTSPNRGLFDSQPLIIRAEAVRSHCQHSLVAAKAASELVEKLASLNDHLEAGGPFLLNESFSLADVCGVCTLIDVYRLALPSEMRSQYQAVLRWLELSLGEEAFDGLGGVEGIQFCSWPASEEHAFAQRVAQVAAESKQAAAPPAKVVTESKEAAVPPAVPNRESPAIPSSKDASPTLKNGASEPSVPKSSTSPAEPQESSANSEPQVVDEKERLRAKHQLMMQQAFGQNGSAIEESVAPSNEADEQHAVSSSLAATGRSCTERSSSLLRIQSPQLGLCAIVCLLLGIRLKARRSWSSFAVVKNAAQYLNRGETLACVVFLAALAERFQVIKSARSFYKRRIRTLRAGHGDPLADWDPWSAAANHSQRSASSTAPARSPPHQEPIPDTGPYKLSHYAGTREEYLNAHVGYRLHPQIEQLSDIAIFELGKKHFNDQAAFLESLESGSIVLPESTETVFGASGKHVANDLSKPRERYIEEDDYDKPPSWWEGNADLFFDLEITKETELASSSPSQLQWWDPEKIGESEHFIAVSKPSGMYVSSDKRGLWDANYMNFVHICHKRFDMAYTQELERRGVCNNIDIQISGVQIFGKNAEALNHYMKENSSHGIKKEYIALVEGRLDDGEVTGQGLIDVPMKKWQDYDRREFGSIVSTHEGFPTVTKYRALRQWRVPAVGSMRFLGKDRWFTLVQLRVLTGRIFQIRAHMAFIGHPVVGDSKHNVRNYEEDCAISPRIFLHCIRMEFEDMDGSRFVASSDLAPDLQGALKRIERLSSAKEQIGPGKLSGLTRILEDTKDFAVDYPEVEEDSAKSFAPRFLTQPSCLNCRLVEQASCKKIQRGNQTAMLWTLKSLDSPAEDEQVETESKAENSNDQASSSNAVDAKNAEDDIKEAPLATSTDEEKTASPEDASEPEWGPSMLWVPTLLQLQQRDFDAGRELMREAATPEQLGRHWGRFGVDWCWAQDGLKRTGWIRLCSSGCLATKWGPGSWELLDRPNGCSPLLLATFNGMEHALRLADNIHDEDAIHHFDVVSMRLLKAGQRSLKTDDPSNSRPLQKDAPSIGPTQGWPSNL